MEVPSVSTAGDAPGTTGEAPHLHLLISRSPDLKRLRDEGYHVTIQANHVVVADVAYVSEQGEVARGALISTLSLASAATTPVTPQAES